MGFDRGESFTFDFEPAGIPFGLKLKGKLSPRSYPIQFERKYSFLIPMGAGLQINQPSTIAPFTLIINIISFTQKINKTIK